jgi:integral membrane protein (TIGR01906 family)
VGLLLGLALAVVILLAGPLLLFNPWTTSALQQRHDVAGRLGTDQATVDRVTGDVLADLYAGGEFAVALEPGVPLLDARERSHMGDVSALVRLLAAILGWAAAIAVAAAFWLRREPARIGRAMLASALSIGAAALVLGVTFAVAFEPAFLAFHAIFFPPGTYLFAPGSQLILLFPSGFWFDASLLAGATIVVTAAIVGIAGWRLARPRA